MSDGSREPPSDQPPPPAAFGYRLCRVSDLIAVGALERIAFGDGGYPTFALRQLHDLFGASFLVAVAPDGAVVGYALGGGSRGIGHAWILSVAVSPGFRRHGIGERLSREVVVLLKQAGFEEVRLTVDPRNDRTRMLYERIGFELSSAEPDYFGPGSPRLVMRLRL